MLCIFFLPRGYPDHRVKLDQRALREIRSAPIGTTFSYIIMHICSDCNISC